MWGSLRFYVGTAAFGCPASATRHSGSTAGVPALAVPWKCGPLGPRWSSKKDEGFSPSASDLTVFDPVPANSQSTPSAPELHDLIQGLLAPMVVVGLPISFSVRRFAK